ncbi:DUF2913 family protein [Vibrio sp. SCSIO 43136]|uniref:DUF2913 family protein n=1 Tax=Vibrio sp. SCSIO 43136 TaxID=2819101 RepID=UPI0020765F7F|nr:DUF2913 family protein [Vibrio sp. SCSIO 43136]USD67281.1 DUF2913 family protein [Vibrio sp. SCSIO 43136]
MKTLLSKEETKFLLLRDLALSGLLHLEFKKLEAKRSLTVSDRNAALSTWLKKQSARQRFKLLKKKVRTLLTSVSSSRGIDLEKVLLEAINYSEEVETTHLEEFLIMVRSIEKEFNSTLMLSSPQQVKLDYKQEKELLCVLSDDLNAHFNSQGKMTTPVNFLARTSRYNRSMLFNAISGFALFEPKVQYEDDDFIRFTLSVSFK